MARAHWRRDHWRRHCQHALSRHVGARSAGPRDLVPGPRVRIYRARDALGYAALAIAVRYNDRWGTFVAALLLTLAIVSHHFTAMGAVEIVPDPTRASDALSLSPAFLALAIAGVALSVLGMSFVGVLADRRLAIRTRNFEEIISQLSLRPTAG